MKQMIKTIAVLAGILLSLLLLFYFFAPVYRFSESKPFSGDNVYNPYANAQPSGWKVLNITDHPVKFNPDSTFSILAENQKITKQQRSITAYTHGFNLFKIKQLCVGAEQVLWIDLPLVQTTGLKQWIIDRLRPHNEIVALENPGYSFRDLKKLTHYDLLEISNGKTVSVAEWDTALSSGQNAWLLIDSRLTTGQPRCFTMVYAPEHSQDELIHSLKSGISYGVILPAKNGKTPVNNEGKRRGMSRLKKVDLSKNILTVTLNQKAKTIRFIQQGGREVKLVNSADSVFYTIQPEDQYIRTEVGFEDGTMYYLNPVIRCHGDAPESKLVAGVDVNATGWLRLLYFIVVAFMFWYFTRKLPGKSKKQKSSLI